MMIVLQQWMLNISSALLLIGLSGCSSQPILAKNMDVKLSREAPDKECREIGKVQGQTLTNHGTQEEAMADLKKDAAIKGANYVQIEQFSAHGTAVNGTAFHCP
jgi:hypothetical protein